jgi:hypothetical protein
VAAPPRSELILRENGLWAILERIGNKVNVVETGHIDRVLAEQDLACWRTFGRLSTSGQAWLRAAARLAGNGSRRNGRRRRGEQHPVPRLDIQRLLLDQNYLCPVTGHVLEPVFDGPWQPSIDRIDNAKGYEPGNMRVVALIANLAMNVWGEKPLLDMAERIVTRGLRPDFPGGIKIERVQLRLLPCNPEIKTPAQEDV